MAIELKVSSSPLDGMAAPADKANQAPASGTDAGAPTPTGQFNALLTKFDQAAKEVSTEDNLVGDPMDGETPASLASAEPLAGADTGAIPQPLMDPLALVSQMQVAGQVPLSQPSQPSLQPQLQTPVQAQGQLQPSTSPLAGAVVGEVPANLEGVGPHALPGHPAVRAGADALGLFELQKQASSGRFELPSGMDGLLADGKKPALAAKLTAAQLASAAPSSVNPLLQGAGDQVGGPVSSADFSEWLSGSLQKSVASFKSESAVINAAGGSSAQATSATRTDMSPFGSWDFASKVGGGTTDVQSTSGAAHASPEQQIADQVSVWVSQNVQSAELKMDAFGSDQVEVSITMAGNEATVQFRSDVAETRDLLQRAAANLESALRSDGLVLSGVSVGASTQGQDNAREASQNTQAFSRKPQAKQDATGETGIRMVARPAVAQGRLDLYV